MNDQNRTALGNRLIREAERKELTTISRTSAWQLEQKGKFPKRRKLYAGGNINVWLLSEIMDFIHSREAA
jgi:predicted DNA-binding transcriptional regulator AlpA